MTAREIALQVLRDFGVRSLDPNANLNNLNGRGTGAGDLSAVVGYLNGALHEIYNDGPAAISQRSYGGVLRPETGVTLSATQYSDTISGLTTYAAWQIGCTIRIADDPNDNQIISITKLARPYMGASGSKTGSIWGDCVALDSAVISHLISPVHLVGCSDVQLVGTLTEFAALGGQSCGSGGGNKTVSTPRWGVVDTITGAGSIGVPKYLRVAPMPAQAFAVEFQARLVPPIIAVTDIDNGDHTTDPLVGFPVDWQQSVLVAIARQRASSDPLFVNEQGRPEILRQFNIARAILKGERPGIVAQEGIFR